jgi:hypothetical protein
MVDRSEKLSVRLRSEPETIAYSGTSVTIQPNGYRPDLHALICEHSGHAHKAVFGGFGGVGTLGALAMLDEWVLPHRPTLCFIECSVVDQGQEGPPPLLREALETLVERLRRADCEPVFLHMPRLGNFGPNPKSVMEVHHEVAAKRDVLEITLQAKKEEGLLSDFVHFTPAGGTWAAKQIKSVLWPALERRALGKPTLHVGTLDGLRLDPAQCSCVLGPNVDALNTGLFRLTKRYIVLSGKDRYIVCNDGRRLFGIIHVLGPHSAKLRVGEQELSLRDEWCDKDRMHAVFLAEPIEGEIEIAAVGGGALSDAELHLIALVTLPAEKR